MILAGPTLGSLLDGRANSLTVVRLIAAVAVVVSHSFPIVYGNGAPQPLSGLTPYNLGQHAVNAFFVISGFTLANSVERRPGLRAFVVARMLRIFPGLFALGVVFAFGFGPHLSALPAREYFSDAHTYIYPFAILLQFNDAVPPHGLFEAVPYAHNVNEPLWTIRYELAAYAGLAAMAALGLFRSNLGLAASFFVVAAYYCLVAGSAEIADGGLYNLGRFGLCFMIGVVAHRLRERIRLSIPVALAALASAIALRSTPVSGVAFMLLVAYLVFCVGALSFGPVGRWLSRNDLSYGAYLYGWPIQQTLVTVLPSLTVAGLIATAAPLAMLAGFLSWRLIERPALSFKPTPPLVGVARETAGPAA